jgi:hypothetical protein
MGGAIAGHFIQQDRNGVAFYEIMTIVAEGGSISYRLKHFNADLTGWEEKNEVQSFGLVAREGDTWFFDGLTIRREDPHHDRRGQGEVERRDRARVRYRRVR